MNAKPKVVAIIQARTGSVRLPHKVLMDIGGKTMLGRVVERVKLARTLDDVLVATTVEKRDDAIMDLCLAEGWLCFRGNEDDVLDRYYQAAYLFGADIVVRITADCPLIDAGLIDDVVEKFLSLYPDIDYVSNTLPPRTYPRGLDTEVISIETLRTEWKISKKWREHVTMNLRNNANKSRVFNITNEKDYSFMRWCVDTAEDLAFVRRVYGHFRGNHFSWLDIIRLLGKRPSWILVDKQVDPQ